MREDVFEIMNLPGEKGQHPSQKLTERANSITHDNFLRDYQKASL
jgi:hypothetical protein